MASSGRSLGALRAVAKLRHALDELERLNRDHPSEAGQLLDLVAKFVEDWRAERSN